MAAVADPTPLDFACRLCGGRALRPYYALGHRDQFRYFRCDDCALVNYDLSGGLDQDQFIELVDPTDDAAKRNHDKDATWRFIERRLPVPGRLLDIGCGTGRLLHLARRAGWDVEGLELSAQAAALARKTLGVRVHVGDFLAPPPAGTSKYDVVVLRHVLEHLVDPVLALERIGARLQAHGHAVLEFPNIEAVDKRIKRWLVRRGWHERAFDADFVPGHCNEFCRRSFELLLRKTGFDLVHWETYSMKPLANAIYTRIPIGNKARTLVRKRPSGS